MITAQGPKHWLPQAWTGLGLIVIIYTIQWASRGAQTVKNLPTMQEIWV